MKGIIKVGSGENRLILDSGDIDGFHICETEGDAKVYVYYSEKEELITALWKVKP